MFSPSSFASCQSWSTISGTQKFGPRVASAIVTSWSSEEKYWLRTRRTSSGSAVTLLPNHQVAIDVFGKP